MASSGNVPNTAMEAGDAHFERGLSIEDAERLASSFKPSWEFDEAPFTAGNGMHAAEMEALGGGGVNGEIHRKVDSDRAEALAPHSPAARVESHEPEVSVIIDRSITAAEIEGRAPVSAKPSAPPPPPVAPALAAPVLAAPVLAPPAFAAPVAAPPRPAPMLQKPEPARFAASDSLEIPVRKSNKPLFIGIGAAAVLAIAVLGIRAATSSEEAPATSTTATSTATREDPRIPPPPAPGETPAANAATTTAGMTSKPAAPTPTHVAAPSPPPAPTHVAAPSPPPVSHTPPAPRAQTAPPRPEPHRPAPTPKSPPKPASGGIVRDVPF